MAVNAMAMSQDIRPREIKLLETMLCDLLCRVCKTGAQCGVVAVRRLFVNRLHI